MQWTLAWQAREPHQVVDKTSPFRPPEPDNRSDRASTASASRYQVSVHEGGLGVCGLAGHSEQGLAPRIAAGRHLLSMRLNYPFEKVKADDRKVEENMHTLVSDAAAASVNIRPFSLDARRHRLARRPQDTVDLF